jgi:6-pyruvoyltetrahydropterin/6-carboxytetrahydropterin synthase
LLFAPARQVTGLLLGKYLESLFAYSSSLRRTLEIMAEFEVYLSKADFKFNCAHFIAYDGFRERLHGHNYKIGVRLIGGETIGDDGYLMDFGDVKKIVRKLCKSMNEYFICPMKSTCIKISEEGPQMCMECQDGASFSFPKEDCLLLPLSHSSAEELAHFMYCSIVR